MARSQGALQRWRAVAGAFLVLLISIAAASSIQGQIRIDGEGWSYTSNCNCESEPVVGGDVVYFAGGMGTVYAVGLRDGILRWTWSPPDNSTFSSNRVGAGMVFAGGDDGRLYALTAKEGKLQWQYQAASCTGISLACLNVVFDDNVVYAASWWENVTAFDPTTGHVIWNAWSPGSDEQSSPILADDLVIVPATFRVYALNRSTGGLVWKYNHSYNNIGDGPTYDTVSRRLLLGEAPSSAVMLSPLMGEQVWTTPIGYGDYSPTPPTVQRCTGSCNSDSVFVMSETCNFHALDRETGALKWNLTVGLTCSPPLIADNTAYFGRAWGPYEVVAVDLQTQKIVWRHSVVGPTAAPILVDGGRTMLVYATSLENSSATLYAIPLPL